MKAEMDCANGTAAICLDKVVVRYPYEVNRATSLKEYFVRRIRRDIRTSYLTALDRVSLEIHPGETFGVIGRNGAGKSTLLKVIARIIFPSSGRLQVWGNVASLLGIGAGFHPELSGKENIFLYSALLGRSQAFTEKHMDDIIAFAELEDFIGSPIRTYSTGMTARLGFAVAMADRPDILLVDEVLGVGDLQFMQKCVARFQEFQKQGTTTVLVSHSLPDIERMCQRAIWLHQGQAMVGGPTAEVVQAYSASTVAAPGEN